MTTLKRENKFWHISHNGKRFICANQETAMMKLQDIANNEPTPDYPYGNSIEPYDIYREDKLTK